MLTFINDKIIIVSLKLIFYRLKTRNNDVSSHIPNCIKCKKLLGLYKTSTVTIIKQRCMNYRNTLINVQACAHTQVEMHNHKINFKAHSR